MVKLLSRDTRIPTKYEIGGGIVLLIIIIVFAIYHILEFSNEQNQLMEEFNDISLELDYKGYIKKIYESESLKKSYEMVFVTMSDGKKFRIFAKRNYNYKGFGIGQLIVVGDSVIKKAGNDSIYIHRNREEIEEQYSFRLYNQENQ